MSGYDYGEFLQAVGRQEIEVRRRPRRGSTVCFVCAVLFPTRRAEWARCCAASMEVDAHHVAVPKQALKREFPNGAYRSFDGVHVPLRPGVGTFVAATPAADELAVRIRSLDDLLMDPRNGVLVRRYHHDALEARRLVIPTALLPEDTLEFVRELGLDWYVDKMQRRSG